MAGRRRGRKGWRLELVTRKGRRGAQATGAEVLVAELLSGHPHLVADHFANLPTQFQLPTDQRFGQLSFLADTVGRPYAEFLRAVQKLEYRDEADASTRCGVILEELIDRLVKSRYGTARAHRFVRSPVPRLSQGRVHEWVTSERPLDVGFTCSLVRDGCLIECKRSAMAWIVSDPAGAEEFGRMLRGLWRVLSERGYESVEVLIITLDTPVASRRAAAEIGFQGVLGAEAAVTYLTGPSSGHEECH